MTVAVLSSRLCPVTVLPRLRIDWYPVATALISLATAGASGVVLSAMARLVTF